MNKKLLIAAAAAAFTASTAFAAVMVDSSGFGFVGKGDVQLAFGWNNKQAQTNANSVTFAYKANDTYDVECEWTTETGGPNSKTIYHDITVPRHVKVNSVIAYDARLKNQYTGYNLTGLGETTTTGTVPEIGGSCPNNNPGTITDVIPTGSTGGLTVSFNGTTVALPNTPVL